MYPFNPQQLLPSNRIEDELLSLSPAKSVPFRLIVPSKGPFFTEDIEIFNGSTELVEGVDYYFTHQFKTGTHITAKPIYGSLYIVNDALAGNIKVSYDTLGGDYLYNTATHNVPSQQVDPTKQLWEDVIGDQPFPPVNILFDIEKDEWKGEAEFNDSVHLLADAVEGRDPTQQELHNFLLSRVERLEAIYNDAQAIAHIANKNNPHGSTAWQARALDKTGNAADAVNAFGRNLQDLAAYINNANLPASKLNEYVQLAAANTLSGSIQYRDGQFSLVSSDGRAGVYFSQDSVNLIATKNVQLEAGTDGTGNFNLLAGNQRLSVSPVDAAKFNDVVLATVANSAELGEDAIDFDRLKVITKNTDTLHWAGDGSQANPLVATIITTDATASQFGITKLGTKSLTLNDGTLAATPWHVRELTGIVDNKADKNLSINGKKLRINPFIRKTDSQIGLNYVQNVSDEDMPVSAANRQGLIGKASGSHTHEADDLTLPVATETVKGVGHVSFDIESGVKDRAIHRSIELGLEQDLERAKARSSSMFPQNVLKIDAYGDNTYLPAPVTGSFKNMSSWRLSLPTLIEGNYLTILRLGRDENGSGLMLSYGELNPDGTCDSIINTVKEYRPNWLGANEIITDVIGGCVEAFIIKTVDDSDVTRHYAVKTNGTMEEKKHQFVEFNISGNGFGAYCTVSWHNDSIYVFGFIEKLFWKVSFGSNDFVTPPLSKPLAEDLKSQLVGKTYNNTDISTDWFFKSGFSRDINSLPLVHINDEYNAGITYGLSQLALVADGKLYFKAGRDYSLYETGGTAPRIGASMVMMYSIDLETYECEAARGSKAPFVLGTGGAADDYSRHSRTENFSSHISSSVSVNRSMGSIINGTCYNFYQHGSDMRIAMSRDSAIALETDYFDFNGFNLDDAGTVNRVTEGATYDGLRKPFEGVAMGPWKGNNPTLFTRCDSDSQVYWAETSDFNGDGFKPSGFRKKISGANWRKCGWNSFQMYSASSNGAKAGVGFCMNSDTGKGYGNPSITNDELVPGTEYTMSSADMTSLSNALKAAIVAKADLIDVIDIEWSLYYRADAGVRLIEVHVRSSDKNSGIYIFTYENSTLVLSGTTMSFLANTGLASIHVSVYKTSSRSMNSIQMAELKCQSFISDFGSGNLAIHLGTPWTSVATNEGYYPKRTHIVTKTGSTYKVMAQGTSYWGTSNMVPGDWGRPFYARANGSVTGVSIFDTWPAWANFNTNTPESVDTAREYNWMSILHDESWNVSFYSEKRLILNGVEYTMPVMNVDLSTLPKYRSTLLYIFAELEDDVPTYNFYETANTQNPGVKIGTVRTGDKNIEDISIDYSVSLGMFRELERHISDYDDPHGIIGSGAEDIGLGDLKNLPLKHELTVVNFSEIFNDWYRFSHNSSGNYPADAGETNSWVYVAATDTIYTPINSATYIGFVSEETFGDYQFETIVGTYQSNGDNDSMSVVLAFVTDDAGKEHTLTVIRSASKEAHTVPLGGNTYSIWYNYLQADQKQLVGTDDTYAVDNGGWGTRKCSVKAVRSGADWVVKSTPISNADPSTLTEYTLTLLGASHPELAIFNGAVRIGYGCQSQPYSSFTNKRRPDTDVENAYASREMVTGVAESEPLAPFVGVGRNGQGVVPTPPTGFTAAECTFVPMLTDISGDNGIRGWIVGFNGEAGMWQTSYGATSVSAVSFTDYIVYAKKALQQAVPH